MRKYREWNILYIICVVTQALLCSEHSYGNIFIYYADSPVNEVIFSCMVSNIQVNCISDIAVLHHEEWRNIEIVKHHLYHMVIFYVLILNWFIHYYYLAFILVQKLYQQSNTKFEQELSFIKLTDRSHKIRVYESICYFEK